MVEKNFFLRYNPCRYKNKKRGVSMDKEEKVDKTKKVEKVEKTGKATQVKEAKKDMTEEPKFSKVTGKDLKKETEMKKIDIQKEKKQVKDKKETKEKGNKKVGYWVGGIVLLLIVLAIVTALLLLPSTPEKTVEGMLNSLKNADFQSVNKYVNYEEIVNKSEMLQNSEFDEETQSLFFDKLSWKILNIAKEKETANVEVEITNKDFNQIITNYTKEALKIAFNGASFTEEEQNNKLKEQLKNEEIETKTVTTIIQLVKQNGEWKIQGSDDLINALLPGLQEQINYLNSIING